jgi:hypothetical protein
LEHLVLQHAESDAGRGAAEVGPAPLAVSDLVAALPIVGVGEVGLGVVVGVAAVSNAQIVSPSEYWAATSVAADQVLFILRHVLLDPVEGEQEGPPPRVVHPAFYAWFPLVVAVAGDSPAELGAYQDQCVLDIVAVLVEGSRAEGVLGGAQHQLQPHRPLEALPQELHMLLAVLVPCLDDQGVEELGKLRGWGE